MGNKCCKSDTKELDDAPPGHAPTELEDEVEDINTHLLGTKSQPCSICRLKDGLLGSKDTTVRLPSGVLATIEQVISRELVNVRSHKGETVLGVPSGELEWVGKDSTPNLDAIARRKSVQAAALEAEARMSPEARRHVKSANDVLEAERRRALSGDSQPPPAPPVEEEGSRSPERVHSSTSPRAPDVQATTSRRAAPLPHAVSWMSGYMVKEGGKWPHKWQRRFFTLSRDALTYHETGALKVLKGTTLIGDEAEARESPSAKGPHAWELHVHDETVHKKRTYHFRCDTESDRRAWLAAVRKVAASHRTRELSASTSTDGAFKGSTVHRTMAK